MIELAATLLLLFAGAAEPPALTPETYPHWHRLITEKDAGSEWRDQGWRPSLWQAVLDAQRERKPILLWAMNGHPLGCT